MQCKAFSVHAFFLKHRSISGVWTMFGFMNTHSGDAADAVESIQVSEESTLGLRIAAIFIILSAGLLGGVPPLIIKALRNQDSLLTFLIRAFSSGVILALALVHILPDAIEELVDMGGVDYPLGGTCVLMGLLVMVFIEHGAHLMFDMPHTHGHTHTHDHGVSGSCGHHTRSHAPLEPDSQSGAHTQDLSQHGRNHWAPTCGPGASVGEPLLLMEPSESGGEDADSGIGGRAPCEGERTEKGPEADFGLQVQEQAKKQLAQLEYSALEKFPDARAATALNGVKSDSFSRNSAGAALLQATTVPTPAAASPVLPLVAAGCTHVHEADGASSCRVAKPGRGCSSSGEDQEDSIHSYTSTCSTSPAATAAAVGASTSWGDAAPARGACQSNGAVFQRSSDHCHDCVSRASPPNFATAVDVGSETGSSPRLRIVAYLFELGCIFHSFIIGISLGVNQTSIAQVRALLIALSFHQALEGLSLTSVINGGGFSRFKAAAMVATYSVTCPLGVTVGIAIAASYDASSTQTRAAQGCLNGISGGMLLYISLVQLMAEDMGKYLLEPQLSAADMSDGSGGGSSSAAVTEVTNPQPPSELPCSHAHGGGGHGGDGVGCRIRLPSFFAFCLGAASMCLLAVWA